MTQKDIIDPIIFCIRTCETQKGHSKPHTRLPRTFNKNQLQPLKLDKGYTAVQSQPGPHVEQAKRHLSKSAIVDPAKALPGARRLPPVPSLCPVCCPAVPLCHARLHLWRCATTKAVGRAELCWQLTSACHPSLQQCGTGGICPPPTVAVVPPLKMG